MKLVCLDSHILIWSIKEEATPGQEAMIPKSKAFLRWLDETNTRVLIPTVIIAEFLMRIPPDMHTTVSNLMQQDFLIAPFDTQAAANFSKIWQTNKEQKVIRELIASGKTRQELKVDSMIVAIAVSRNAECVYSYDDGLKKFANGYIDVKQIPELPEQKALLFAE